MQLLVASPAAVIRLICRSEPSLSLRQQRLPLAVVLFPGFCNPFQPVKLFGSRLSSTFLPRYRCKYQSPVTRTWSGDSTWPQRVGTNNKLSKLGSFPVSDHLFRKSGARDSNLVSEKKKRELLYDDDDDGQEACTDFVLQYMCMDFVEITHLRIE